MARNIDNENPSVVCNCAWSVVNSGRGRIVNSLQGYSNNRDNDCLGMKNKEICTNEDVAVCYKKAKDLRDRISAMVKRIEDKTEALMQDLCMIVEDGADQERVTDHLKKIESLTKEHGDTESY